MSREPETTKICTKCKEALPVEEFHKTRKHLTSRRSTCKKCDYAENRRRDALRGKNYKFERREILRENIWRYKKEHPCVDCAESDFRVLEFDHIGEKNFGI